MENMVIVGKDVFSSTDEFLKAYPPDQFLIFTEESLQRYHDDLMEKGGEDDIEKGRKDISKLVKKQIMTKRGFLKTVWVAPVSIKRAGTGRFNEAVTKYNEKKRYMSKDNARAFIERHYGKDAAEFVHEGHKVDSKIKAHKMNEKPSEKQKESGNYKKAHIHIHGMEITIENPKGSQRTGKDPNGKQWSHTMKSHYGYFKRTMGKDGDQIDSFIGEHPLSEHIFVIDQNNPKTGKFDETKVMLGYLSEKDAKEAYLENYDKGWKGLGSITSVSVAHFKEWLGDGKRQKKPFSEYRDNKDAGKSIATYRGGTITPEVRMELQGKYSGVAPISEFIDVHGQEVKIYGKEGVYSVARQSGVKSFTLINEEEYRKPESIKYEAVVESSVQDDDNRIYRAYSMTAAGKPIHVKMGIVTMNIPEKPFYITEEGVKPKHSTYSTQSEMLDAFYEKYGSVGKSVISKEREAVIIQKKKVNKEIPVLFSSLPLKLNTNFEGKEKTTSVISTEIVSNNELANSSNMVMKNVLRASEEAKLAGRPFVVDSVSGHYSEFGAEAIVNDKRSYVYVVPDNKGNVKMIKFNIK